MDKVLILGATGKLGRSLVEAFTPGYEVVGASASGGLDAANQDQVEALLNSIRPRIVLNAAALNGLDACEREPEQALRLNTLLPKWLASRSRDLQFQLIHFSSDAVFDGKGRPDGYVESDAACPINVYGFTKFGGDCFVQAESENFLIFRLSVLLGDSGTTPQFIERMIARARIGETLRVSDDIICSPSYVRDLAGAVRQAVDEARPSGLYHLANSGSASLFELVRSVLHYLNLEAPLLPVSHAEFPSMARKNLHAILRSEKGTLLRPWQEALQAYCHAL